MTMKENARNKDTWLRGLFIIVFGIIFYFLYMVIWLTVIFQFLTKVLTGELNKNLSDFSEKLTRFAFQILLYITFQSEERPFPFSPWPENNPEISLPEPEDDAEQATELKKDKSDSD